MKNKKPLMSQETILTKRFFVCFQEIVVDFKLRCCRLQSLLLASCPVLWKCYHLTFTSLASWKHFAADPLTQCLVFSRGLRFTICMKMVELLCSSTKEWIFMNICLFQSVTGMGCELHSFFLFWCFCFYCVIKHKMHKETCLFFLLWFP